MVSRRFRWFLVFLLIGLLFIGLAEAGEKKKLIGQLNLEGDGTTEASVLIWQYYQAPKHWNQRFLVQISRNSIDSKYMDKEKVLKGDIDIPIPVPFINYITRSHSIKYHKSDDKWDYFLVYLRSKDDK